MLNLGLQRQFRSKRICMSGTRQGHSDPTVGLDRGIHIPSLLEKEGQWVLSHLTQKDLRPTAHTGSRRGKKLSQVRRRNGSGHKETRLLTRPDTKASVVALSLRSSSDRCLSVQGRIVDSGSGSAHRYPTACRPTPGHLTTPPQILPASLTKL